MSDPGTTDKVGDWLFRPIDEASAREIALWRYPPPYDFYNCPDDGVEGEVLCLLNPDHQYRTVWDQDGGLVGYAGFGEDCRVPGGDYGADALDVGGGLRPGRCGRGLGAGFWGAVLEVARRHYAPEAFRVTVAAFNKRALRVWERLSFRVVEVFEATHSGEPFVVLVSEPDPARGALHLDGGNDGTS